MVEVIGNKYVPVCPSTNVADSDDHDSCAAAKLKTVCRTARDVLLKYIKTDVSLEEYPGTIQLPRALFVRKMDDGDKSKRVSVSFQENNSDSRGKGKRKATRSLKVDTTDSSLEADEDNGAAEFETGEDEEDIMSSQSPPTTWELSPIRSPKSPSRKSRRLSVTTPFRGSPKTPQKSDSDSRGSRSRRSDKRSDDGTNSFKSDASGVDDSVQQNSVETGSTGTASAPKSGTKRSRRSARKDPVSSPEDGSRGSELVDDGGSELDRSGGSSQHGDSFASDMFDTVDRHSKSDVSEKSVGHSSKVESRPKETRRSARKNALSSQEDDSSASITVNSKTISKRGSVIKDSEYVSPERKTKEKSKSRASGRISAHQQDNSSARKLDDTENNEKNQKVEAEETDSGTDSESQSKNKRSRRSDRSKSKSKKSKSASLEKSKDKKGNRSKRKLEGEKAKGKKSKATIKEMSKTRRKSPRGSGRKEAMSSQEDESIVSDEQSSPPSSVTLSSIDTGTTKSTKSSGARRSTRTRLSKDSNEESPIGKPTPKTTFPEASASPTVSSKASSDTNVTTNPVPQDTLEKKKKSQHKSSSQTSKQKSPRQEQTPASTHSNTSPAVSSKASSDTSITNNSTTHRSPEHKNKSATKSSSQLSKRGEISTPFSVQSGPSVDFTLSSNTSSGPRSLKSKNGTPVMVSLGRRATPMISKPREKARTGSAKKRKTEMPPPKSKAKRKGKSASKKKVALDELDFLDNDTDTFSLDSKKMKSGLGALQSKNRNVSAQKKASRGKNGKKHKAASPQNEKKRANPRRMKL